MYYVFIIIGRGGYNVFLKSNLYDLTVDNIEINAMVWKGQSSVTNPRSLEGGSKIYADNLVGYLTKNNILIKPEP